MITATKERRIRRNASKKIDKVFSNAHNVTVWTLYGGSEKSAPEYARAALDENSYAYLYHRGEGHYAVHVHQNLFYNFDSVQV